MFSFRKHAPGSLVGQIFQPTARTTYGLDLPTWRVESLFIGVGGVEHARLTRETDATETRAVAVPVLLDPKRYRRVG